MVPSMEKINGKFAPIFKLKTFHWLTPTSVSQACYFPPFFHFYFPPFMFDPSHTCIVTGPQTEWLLPLQGFLLGISMTADLPYLLLTQILSMAYCYLSFCVKPPKLTPIHTLIFSASRMVAVHSVYRAITWILPAFSSPYIGTLHMIHFRRYSLNFHVFPFCFTTCTLSRNTLFTLLLKQQIVQGFSRNRLLKNI